jgi:DNA polymerase-1
VQGTAADIIKLAMVRVHKALRDEGLRAKLILQVHDELLIEAPKEEAEKVTAILKKCMEQVYALSVPLVADVKTGESWYETK